MSPIALILILLAIILVVIAAIALIRTLNYAQQPDEITPLTLPKIDGEDVARRIGLAVQLHTISNPDPEKIDPQPFEDLRDLLRTLYQRVELQLSKELVNKHALLFTWLGSDPTLEPVAFTAHQDVVPAEDGENSTWSYPPFGGQLAEGAVWGRGTLDCKGTLIALLEAVETLLKAGFQPERTVYLAFGHDEEVGGVSGAKAIAGLLASRGVHLSFLLDEGGSVTSGLVPGVESPVGLIAIGEKGHMSLKLHAQADGGHASTPPAQTAIGALSLAIATLESNPFPQDLDLVQFMMSFLGDAVPFSQRLMLANPWLFGGQLKRRFAASPASNALTRTTVAPTMIKAGSAANVLPAEAEAIVNVRVLNGESLAGAFRTINDLVGDEVITVSPAFGDSLADPHHAEPSPLSEVDAPQYRALEALVRASFPGAGVAPVILNGATDAAFYAPLCEHVYRFSPYFLTREETESVHGVDEHLSFSNAARMVGFYQVLIQQISLKDQLPAGLEEPAHEGQEEERAPRGNAEIREEQAGRGDLPLPPGEAPEEAPELLPEELDQPLKVRKMSKGR